MERCIAVCLSLFCLSAGAGDVVSLRDWTVKDSIAVRYFARDLAQSGFITIPVNPAVPSPDRRHFFVISRHGDLERDCNLYELQVFSVDEIRHRLDEPSSRGAPRPVARGSLCSPSSTWSGMSDPKWLDDERIVFLGQDIDGARNVFQLDLRSGELRRLTDVRVQGSRKQHGILGYAIGGSSIVYTAPLSGQVGVDLMERYPATYVSELSEAFEPVMRGGIGLFASYRGAAPKRIVIPPDTRIVSVSPDGRWAMLIMRPEDPAVRQSWAAYAGTQPTHAAQFFLWDIREHRGRPLLQSPLGEATTNPSGELDPFDVENPWARMVSHIALWSEDGRRVVVTNTTLPLNGDPERRRMAYIVDYELATGRWSAIAPIADLKSARRAGKVGWLQAGKEFLVEQYVIPKEPLTQLNFARRVEGDVYTLTESGWQRHTVESTVGLPVDVNPFSQEDLVLEGGLSVNLRQSSNDPPRLIASAGGHELTLSEPDSALEGIWRARTQQVKWREPDGREVSGLLLMPRKTAGPLPLVIQAYYALPEMFFPDGISPTAYAAQPLVAQGFAVLFMDIPAIDRQEITNTPREGEAMVERIDAAITELAGQGIVDARHVGLVGFSRAAYMTYYAVTHPGRMIPAAAVVADGVTYSLGGQAFEYARFYKPVRNHGLDANELMYGGSFSDATAMWLKHDPTLNAHRARTPTLFAYNGRNQAFAAVDTLGYFRAAGCPAEFLLFRDGTHQLNRPREREASLQATVDWMNFWIRGVQDPDPGKTETYGRWVKMRALQKDGRLLARDKKMEPLTQ